MHAQMNTRMGKWLGRFAWVGLLLPLLVEGCNNKDTGKDSPSKDNAQNGPSSSSEQTIEGYLDTVTSEALYGWVRDSKQPNKRLTVDIFDGEKKLGTAQADEFRKDVAEVMGGDGKHGFQYTFPASLNDGKSHTIRVRVSGTNVELLNSPQTIKSP